MSETTIHNEDCFETMARMPVGAVNIVLTSPPYNTGRDGGKHTIADNKSGYATHRYDIHSDGMTDEAYEDWTVKLFCEFARIVNLGGCVIYNLSYGRNGASAMLNTMSRVTRETDWRCFDIIYWKKKTAMPDNQSKNKLTRIVEPVYVFVRSGEDSEFFINKKQTSQRSNGQPMFSPIYNVFEAANNDGENALNKATFSTEFVLTLLNIYGKNGDIVYDPFSGTGTTALACKIFGADFVGSEISNRQCDFSKKRLSDILI